MRERRSKGFGSVRERKRKDGTRAFMLKVTIESKDYVRTVDAKNKREAAAMLPAFVAEIRSGAYAKAAEERAKLASQPTLADFAPVFLASHVSQDPDRAATRAAYDSMLRLHILPAIGACRLSEITTPLVRETMQGLYRHGRAMATIKLAFAVTHRCFDAAIEDGYITESPVPKFSKLRLAVGERAEETAQRHALSAAQVTALLNGCGDPDIYLWASIMASCGLRPGEANGLRWQDIDFKASELHVRGSAKHVGGRTWVGKPKTPSSRRTVTMGPVLAGLLTAERERQEAMQREILALPANVATAKPLLPAEAYIFCADAGTPEGLRSPRSPGSLSGPFRRAVKRAGLPVEVSPHWLRHTAISHALAEGTSLADASKRAGHKNPAITAAIYTHAVGEGEKKAAMIGDNLLSAGAGVEQIGIHKGQK